MQVRPKISADQAISLVTNKLPLKGFSIVGQLDFYKTVDLDGTTLIIEDCDAEIISAVGCEFNFRVSLINSTFIKGEFNYTYFKGGLFIDGCSFKSYLDFEAGGHNISPNIVYINASKFDSFVNFFDCWFWGPVVVTNNIFASGTNLLGNLRYPYRVQFDTNPFIENNTGRLDQDHDGGRPANWIEVNPIT